MTAFKPFYVWRLPNDTHLTFNMSVLDFARHSETVAQQFASILAPYEAAIEQEDHYMHQMQGSQLTKDIEQLDKDRDRLYYILAHQVDVYLHYDESPRRTDAMNIDRYLKVNKVDTSAQYDRETGMILNLVQDLTEHCEAELKRLELWDNVNLLAGVNARLYELMQERTEQTSDRVLNAVVDARKETDRIYRALTEAVSGFAAIDAAPYLSFIRPVNETINRLNRAVFKTGSTGGATNGGSTGAGDTAEGDTDDQPTDGDQNDGGDNQEPEVIIFTPDGNE